MNILLTGGTSGLGKATLALLAGDPSNKVYFTYSRSKEKAAQIEAAYPGTKGIQCDFKSSADVDGLLVQMPAMELDVLINNAWADRPQGKHFTKLTTEEIMGMFANNIIPTIRITQAAISLFKKKKSGKIITVITASVLGVPTMGCSLYSSTKAYLYQMAKSWSRECIRFGITSNCVSPDFMQTEFTSDTDERIIEQMQASHPLKQLLKPEEVALVIKHLVESPAQVNGVNIPINAGQTII